MRKVSSVRPEKWDGLAGQRIIDLLTRALPERKSASGMLRHAVEGELTVEVESAIAKLLAYCRANDWAGYDPYDALNSGIFTALPFLDSRIPRLVLTQALKRSPVNLRRLLLRSQDPESQGTGAVSFRVSRFRNSDAARKLTPTSTADRAPARSCDRRVCLTGAGDTVFRGRRARLWSLRVRPTWSARHSSPTHCWTRMSGTRSALPAYGRRVRQSTLSTNSTGPKVVRLASAIRSRRFAVRSTTRTSLRPPCCAAAYNTQR